MSASGIGSYVNSAFPAVCIETAEEERFTRALLAEFPSRDVYRVAATGGLIDARTSAVIDAAATYSKALAVASKRDELLLVILDFQAVARNATAYRSLKDAFPALKARGSCVILIAPAWQLPPELEHDIPIVPYALPTRAELDCALRVVSEGAEVAVDDAAACLDAAAGLTLQEAENAFALTVVERGAFAADRIADEKMRLVRQSGFLEVWPPTDPSAVGGQGGLKEYFTSEVIPSRDDPDLRVRGILLVGIPGTGKSLVPRVASAILGWPVLRMDIAALKGALVGQSEQNMRSALKLTDAVAPAILWIDEIEKGVGGYASSAHTDSGVTLAIVGTLLVWMQEHTSPVIVIATCNDYTKLPPELTRAGRFDERFFVDLPTAGERREIAAVHLSRFGCPVDGLPSKVADLTAAWTGAEIEQLVKSAARRSGRKPNADLLADCAREIKPISRVRAQEIEALRSWAQGTLRLANSPEEPTPDLGRRLRPLANHG